MAAANELLPSTSFNDGSYDDYDNPTLRSSAGHPQGVYDFLPEGPKCKCCPYGYHVDVGFVQYAEEAKRGKYLRHLEQIQRYKKKLRQTMEVFYKQHGRYPPMLNPPDLIKGSEGDSESLSGSMAEDAGGDEDTFAVFGTTEHHSSTKVVPKAEVVVSQNNSSSFVSMSGGQQQSSSTGADYVDCQKTTVVTHGDCAACQSAHCPECSSASLTTFLESETVQITREQLTKIREQMANSLARLRELEGLVKTQPVLEARLNVLLEEKDLFQAHLEEKEKEAAEFRLRYEESLTEIRTLETLRAKDEVDFSQKISAVEMKIPKPVVKRDQGVGVGDVRELYFLQPQQLRNYKTDCAYDLPESVLSTLRTRWETEFRRAEAEKAPIMRSVGVAMVPATNTVSVDAKPVVQRADVWQSVDMDDEEWHNQEMNLSSSTDVLSWFQEQVATSRDHRTITQALRRAYQFNHSEFKALVIRLLAKNLRSQAVQVKPSVRTSGMMTVDADICDQGVGEDSVNVEVRPRVEHFSVGVGARPSVVSKIAFTERVFKYDAATNTQPVSMSEACTLTSPYQPPVFSSSIQTDRVRSREQSQLTEDVRIVNDSRMASTAINTERMAATHASTNTELANRMERSMGTEQRRLYQTSVCTEPVRTSNKLISVDLSPPPEYTPSTTTESANRMERSMGTEQRRLYETAVSTEPVRTSSKLISVEPPSPPPTSETEKVKTETWEEVTYFDRNGRMLRSSAGPDTCALRSSVTDTSYSPSASRSTIQETVTATTSRSTMQETLASPPLSHITIEETVASPPSYTPPPPAEPLSEASEASDVNSVSSASRSISARSSARSSMRSKSSSSTRVEQRSRSSGGETTNVRTQGSLEFGGGTVRPEPVSKKSSQSGSSSGTVTTTVTEGFARSRIPMTVEKKESEYSMSSSDHQNLEVTMTSTSLKSSVSSRSKTDVKSSDLYIACQTFARWMNDSTTTTSKQMNEAEASIRQFWFRLVGSRSSRHDAVEPYLVAIRELGPSVLSKVVNMADDTGNTVIHYAVSNANWSLVQLLLNTCPVQVDRLNRAGYSVLMLAALCNVSSDEHVSVAKQLVRASRNVDLSSSSGAKQTALMLAASHGCVPLVEALLAAGAQPNMQDKEGSTALMCASEHGHVEVVRALLAKPDTNCNMKDNEGLTALSIAMDNNHRDISLLIYARENLGKATAGKGKNSLSQRRHVHISENSTSYKYK